MRGLEPVSFYSAQGVCFRSTLLDLVGCDDVTLGGSPVPWFASSFALFFRLFQPRPTPHPGRPATGGHLFQSLLLRPAHLPACPQTVSMRQSRPASWPIVTSWITLFSFVSGKRGPRPPRRGACGRDARAPGWAPLPIALAPRGRDTPHKRPTPAMIACGRCRTASPPSPEKNPVHPVHPCE